jgi:ribose-phosphate pyrophosphokinase
MYLFSLPNTIKLARKICQKTNLKLGGYERKFFSDGEMYLCLKNKVKNQTVYLIGATYQPNDNIIELLMLTNALKINGASQIIAIIPYFGYARQDQIDRPGAPITAQLMGNLLKQAGVNQFITIDIHSQRDQKYLRPNLINLQTLQLFADYFKKNINLQNTIVVAPDNGAINRARKLASLLDPLPIIVMQKYRPKQNTAKVKKFQKNIKGKNIIITDDIIDTAGTITAVCQELKRHQVKNIYICATHGVFSGQARQRLQRASIKQIIVTDTLKQAIGIARLKILSIVPLLTKYIKEEKAPSSFL